MGARIQIDDDIIEECMIVFRNELAKEIIRLINLAKQVQDGTMMQLPSIIELFDYEYSRYNR
tara:strand:- start:9594 stop:9779 length:186 start_codon:yes stop_codon:yes gene_type:complete